MFLLHLRAPKKPWAPGPFWSGWSLFQTGASTASLFNFHIASFPSTPRLQYTYQGVDREYTPILPPHYSLVILGTYLPDFLPEGPVARGDHEEVTRQSFFFFFTITYIFFYSPLPEHINTLFSSRLLSASLAPLPFGLGPSAP